MMDDYESPMEYFTPQYLDSDWGYKILQFVVAIPDVTISVEGPNPAGNYMLVFGNQAHKEELEVVLRFDQLVAVTTAIWSRFEEEVDET